MRVGNIHFQGDTNLAQVVLGVASAIVCDGVSAAAVVFAPEYGNEDEHQV
jgi:hypothetical protein